MIWNLNFINEKAIEEKSQMSCQGYKGKLVIIVGIGEVERGMQSREVCGWSAI